MRAGQVDIANSDAGILKIFLRFLREILKIDESRLRVYLYCFTDQNLEELMQYWSKELVIPRNQFIRPYIREKTDSSERRMSNGVAHVRVSDKMLLAYLLDEIDRLKSWAGGRAVKCTRL